MRRKTIATLAASAAFVLGATLGLTAAGHPAAKGDALYGFDTGQALTDAQASTAGVTADRVYFSPSAGVPSSWPSSVPGGMSGIVSIRPSLTDVASGALDGQLAAFLRTAPAHSLFTIWHEANEPRLGLSASVYTAAVKHVANLVARDGIPVRVGQIFGTYPVEHGQDLAPWVVKGLSFYGLDGYKDTSADTPASVFGGSVKYIRAVYPQAQLMVTETNIRDNTGTQADADAWVPSAWTYACRSGFRGFLIYADHPGTTQPPLPSAPVLQQLSIAVAQGDC